jgi:hypothetical protein
MDHASCFAASTTRAREAEHYLRIGDEGSARGAIRALVGKDREIPNRLGLMRLL